MDFHDKTICILGLAREGASLARYFSRHGAKIIVTDSAPAESLQSVVDSLGDGGIHFVLGGDHPEVVEGADFFFVSPGIPEWNPVFQAAVGAGLAVQSMTTLFFDLCRAPMVGITGSSGKTTTSSLISHILRVARRHVVVGGNIGTPMLDLLPMYTGGATVVLELSSFQLSLLQRSPHIAVITNISPNHLDRHGTMERYIAAKRRILEFQGESDYAIVNGSDPQALALTTSTPGAVLTFAWKNQTGSGAGIEGNTAGLYRGSQFVPVMPLHEIPLLGRHNVENVLGALTAADVLGVPPEDMRRGVQTFTAAPHRLQTVAELDGVRYVDDSIATSPARALVALQAIDAPIHLIAGGRDKNLPWDELAAVIAQKVETLLLLGEAAPMIEAAVQSHLPAENTSPCHIIRCSSMDETVEEARRRAHPGDVVLLSPACASYDMFHNFEERGAVFARAAEAVHAT